MKTLLAILIVIPFLFLSSCGGSSAVGTCTCSCLLTSSGGSTFSQTDVLSGNYTESECSDAALLVEDGGSNDCGNLSDGSAVCSSSWVED